MARLKNTLKKATALVGMCLLLGVISSQAASLTVSTTADNGIGSLRQAIIDATSAGADTITFDILTTDPGYNAAENRFTINLLNPLPNIPKESVIINNFQPQAVTVKGNNSFRIFTLVNGAVVIINNLTISDGFSNGEVGGGIYMGDSSTLFLNGCTVSDNAASDSGGGVYMSDSGTLHLANTTITRNTASNGGGIFINDSGTLNINNSTVNANSTLAGGNGGGIFNGTSGTVTAKSSTIDGNTALGGSGGGIYNTATITFTNNTITDNNANVGGGIYNGHTATLNNNLIALNTAPDGSDLKRGISSVALTADYNLIGEADGSGIDPPGTNQLGSTLNPIDPQIGHLGNNGGATFTRALLIGSPAIDKGSSPGIITDQRGLFRPVDNPVIPNASDGADIGSYEVQEGTEIIVSGTISYGITAENQATKFVSGVDVNAAGTSQLYARSDDSGFYQLSGLITDGNYIVTPSKTGDINGISPFDATMILRYVAANGTGPNALNANQRIAADTNGDGDISPFDATLILRYVAAGSQNANTGQAGNWEFSPLTHTYPSLSSSLTNENYEAILIGDVNGSWTPPAFISESHKENLEMKHRKTHKETATETMLLPQSANRELNRPDGTPTEIQLSFLTNVAETKAGIVIIPVWLSNSSNKAISGYTFAVDYNPEMLQPANKPLITTDTFSDNFQLSARNLESLGNRLMQQL